MLLPWTIIDSEYLLRRPWLNLRVDQVRQPDGSIIDEFHVVEYPDWTCVVCFTEDERVVLVEQYRHGLGRTTFEFPAGIIEPGEPPLMAARRELVEETGFVADAWTSLGHCSPNPSKQTNYAHLFLATGARQVHEQLLDTSESIAVHLAEAGDVLRLADTEGFQHGIHLAALFRAQQRGLWPGS